MIVLLAIAAGIYWLGFTDGKQDAETERSFEKLDALIRRVKK